MIVYFCKFKRLKINYYFCYNVAIKKKSKILNLNLRNVRYNYCTYYYFSYTMRFSIYSDLFKYIYTTLLFLYSLFIGTVIRRYYMYDIDLYVNII